MLPQRDHSANIKRLIPLVNDNAVEEKINKASDLSTNKQGETMKDFNKTNSAEEKISLEKGSKTLLSQVVGIIIGSPEFQRK